MGFVSIGLEAGCSCCGASFLEQLNNGHAFRRVFTIAQFHLFPQTLSNKKETYYCLSISLLPWCYSSTNMTAMAGTLSSLACRSSQHQLAS